MTLARQQDELKRIPLLEQNIARLEKRLGEEEKGAAEARQARDTALEKRKFSRPNWSGCRAIMLHLRALRIRCASK